MRNRLFLPPLALAVLVAGCHKSPAKQVALEAAFSTIPLPPNAQALVREGGVDAMQIVLVTPLSPDSVVAYYRKVLSAEPFHLVNERSSGKSTALYAEQESGPPIWVTVAPNGSEGSQVVLAGAKDADHPDPNAAKLKTADSVAAATLPVRTP
jgi:hypothetical protein